MKNILKILKDNNNKFEYGQGVLFDIVIEGCDDFKFNGMSSLHDGYYWHTITIDGQDYEIYSKER